MLFNSVEFLLFFPVVVAIYFALPQRIRWALLLAASYLFYAAWNPIYLVLIFASTFVDYRAAIAMEKAGGRRARRAWLLVSLCANLGLLFVFKYLTFALESTEHLLTWAGHNVEVVHLDILLPVGISFYTFQTLSYTIEVFRGRQRAVHHFGHFALYVSFFPQLVAGPIERPQRLLPQLTATHTFDYERVVSGLRQVLWGMFKKVVIADRLAIIVDAVYLEPERYPGSVLILATVLFAFQIYCDFSGYSDIAIGTARVLGIDLMKNFNRPYFATSIADFWRRWHISLSTWFRDYVYIPIGGSQGSSSRWLFALVATFGLSGLWHGANWTFLAWGCCHVIFYLLEKLLQTSDPLPLQSEGGLPEPSPIRTYLSMAVTFAMVCFAWIFFRANSIGDATYIISHLGTRFFDFAPNGGVHEMIASWDISVRALQLNLALIGLLLLVEARSGESPATDQLERWQGPLRWAVYLILAFAMMNLGTVHEIPFVYFQF